MITKLIQLLLLTLFLTTIGVSAHWKESINIVTSEDVITYHNTNIDAIENPTPNTDLDFKRMAREYGIPTRLVKDFSEAKNGYYIIAGVYGDRANANNFVQKLKLKRLSPIILTHPVSKLNYISLAQHENWKEAINSCATAMNGKYKSKVWIMNVQGSNSARGSESVAGHIKKSKENTGNSSKEFIKVAKENSSQVRGFKEWLLLSCRCFW